MDDNIKAFEAALAFKSEAHKLFGTIETSKSRIHTLDESYRLIGEISVEQDDQFRQAIRCCEHGLYRASHVVAFTGLIDWLQKYCERDAFATIRAALPRHTINDLSDIRENVGEHLLIEKMKDCGLLKRGEAKAFLGLLHRRNECAHPTSYYPDMNQTIGYLSEIFQRLKAIQGRVGDN